MGGEAWQCRLEQVAKGSHLGLELGSRENKLGMMCDFSNLKAHTH